jgi:hypothetical protein
LNSMHFRNKKYIYIENVILYEKDLTFDQ